MTKANPTTMSVRLGRVLYWSGWATAVVFFALAAFTWVSFHRMDDSLYSKGAPLIAVGGPILWGVASVLIGRAARYVLADE
jgi:hypothetical protein